MKSKLSSFSITIKLILIISFSLPLITSAFYTFPTKIDTKAERINIQTVLNTVMVPSPNLTVDGVLGKKSIQAIQSFQESKGLVPDGKVGPITRSTLEKAQTGSTSTTYTSTTSSTSTNTTSGCLPGAIFNTLNGQRCNSTSSSLTGCNGTNKFNTITGALCTNTTTSVTGGGGGSTTTPPTTTNPPITPPTCYGSTSQSCPISNGSGIQTRTCNNNTWSSYNTCTVSSCNTGYTQSGNGCVVATTNTTKIIRVTASTSSDLNQPPNKTLDGILSDTSYWSAEGNNQWISYELSQTTIVSYVRFAFYAESQRYFDIQYSTNGTTWINASSGLTSRANMSNQYQTFSFSPVTAKYIRFLGHGSSISGPNGWNSVTETDINGFAVNLTVTPPVCVPEPTSTTCLNKCGSQTNNCGESVSCTACVVNPPPTNSSIDIIYSNNFEQNTLGDYLSSEAFRDWNNGPYPYEQKGRTYINQNTNDSSNTSKYLRIFHKKGTYGGTVPYEDSGTQLFQYLTQGYDELYFSYKIKVQEGFEYNVTKGKVPSMGGFLKVTYAGQCVHGDDDFSGSLQFGPMSGGIGITPYIYHVDMWKNSFNPYMNYEQFGSTCDEVYERLKDDPVYGGVYGSGGQTVGPIVTGGWHTFTERIVMNTLGQNNGIVELFLDGQLYSQRTDYTFRTIESLKINKLSLVSFFGGGAESAVREDMNFYFDDFVAYKFKPGYGQPVGNTPSASNRILPVINF